MEFLRPDPKKKLPVILSVATCIIGWLQVTAQIKDPSLQSNDRVAQPYIEVTGKADSLVTPDEIFISIRISESDTKDKTSVEDLENQLVSSLKTLGIDPEKALSVTDLTSNYRYYLFKGKNVLKSRQYLLKVPDAVTASKVFIHLEQLGISNASIDHVDYSDLEGIRMLLQRKAVENALEKARAMTLPLDQQVGPALWIKEDSGPDVTEALSGRVSGITVGYGLNEVEKAAAPLPDIGFKKIPVSERLSIRFSLH